MPLSQLGDYNFGTGLYETYKINDKLNIHSRYLNSNDILLSDLDNRIIINSNNLFILGSNSQSNIINLQSNLQIVTNTLQNEIINLTSLSNYTVTNIDTINQYNSLYSNLTDIKINNLTNYTSGNFFITNNNLSSLTTSFNSTSSNNTSNIININGTLSNYEEDLEELQKLQLAQAGMTAAGMATLAAAIAYNSFFPTPGVPIEPEFEAEYDNDEKKLTLQPLTLMPAYDNEFFDSGGLLTQITRDKGRVGLNRPFPQEEFDMIGSFKQEQGLFTALGKTTLGQSVESKISGVIINPNDVCVQLGNNANITTSGSLNSSNVITNALFNEIYRGTTKHQFLVNNNQEVLIDNIGLSVSKNLTSTSINTGTATLTSNLNVAVDTILNYAEAENMFINSNLNVSDTLDTNIANVGTLNANTLNITNIVTFDSNLNVFGEATFSSNVYVEDDFYVIGNSVLGLATINNLIVNNLTNTSNLTVSNNITSKFLNINSNAFILGTVGLSNTLNVAGKTTLSNNLTVNGITTLNGNVGINTSTPQSALHILGQKIDNETVNGLHFGNSFGDAQIQNISMVGSKEHSINFTTSNAFIPLGRINYNHSNQQMALMANGTDRVFINSNGLSASNITINGLTTLSNVKITGILDYDFSDYSLASNITLFNLTSTSNVNSSNLYTSNLFIAGSNFTSYLPNYILSSNISLSNLTVSSNIYSSNMYSSNIYLNNSNINSLFNYYTLASNLTLDNLTSTSNLNSSNVYTSNLFINGSNFTSYIPTPSNYVLSSNLIVDTLAVNTNSTINNLTTTGISTLSYFNNGNYIELESVNNNSFIDFHSSTTTTSTDYNSRIISTGPKLNLLSTSLGLITNNVERISIISSGNVGIGITTPTAKLQVVGDMLLSSGSILFNSSTRQMINLFSTTYGLGVQANTLYNRTAGQFVWYKGGIHDSAQGVAGAGGSTLMILDANGNLGLGTASPQSKIDITGNANITSDLNVGANFTTNKLIISNSITTTINDNSPASDYTLLIKNNLSSNNLQTGVGFMTAINPNIYTPGAGVCFERTGGNSFGKLHFRLKSGGLINDPLPIYMTIAKEAIGIGTTEPTANLHVIGSAIVSSNLTVQNLVVNGTISGLPSNVEYTLSSNLILDTLTVNNSSTFSNVSVSNIDFKGSLTGLTNLVASNLSLSNLAALNITTSNLTLGQTYYNIGDTSTVSLGSVPANHRIINCINYGYRYSNTIPINSGGWFLIGGYFSSFQGKIKVMIFDLTVGAQVGDCLEISINDNLSLDNGFDSYPVSIVKASNGTAAGIDGFSTVAITNITSANTYKSIYLKGPLTRTYLYSISIYPETCGVVGRSYFVINESITLGAPPVGTKEWNIGPHTFNWLGSGTFHNRLTCQKDLNVTSNLNVTGIANTNDANIKGILRLGIAGTSTIAGYQGGTIYFNGPFGDHGDGTSGIQNKNYTNGVTSTEATELLLWQLNDPFLDASGPDRIRLYAGEIRFDTYNATASIGSQYTESTRMIVLPNGWVGIGTTNPTAQLQISAGVGVNATVPNLALTNGVGFGESSKPQLSFGYQGTKTYNHYISTRHQNASISGNSIDFYTCDGTGNNTINNTTYCMSMNGGKIGINTFNPTDQFHVTGNSTFAGSIQCRGTRFTQGANATFYGNIMNFFWTGSSIQAWVDTTNVGTLSLTSDYRIKKNIVNIPNGSLEIIKNIRPVTYYIKNNGIFKEDFKKNHGFIAHEIQELIPDAANGIKDAVNNDGEIQPQSLNLAPIVAHLVKAIQELTSKVEFLEALLEKGLSPKII